MKEKKLEWTLENRINGIRTFVVVHKDGSVGVLLNIVLCGNVMVWLDPIKKSGKAKMSIGFNDKKSQQIFNKLNIAELIGKTGAYIFTNFSAYPHEWVLIKQDYADHFAPKYLVKREGLTKLKTKPRYTPLKPSR